MQRRLMKVRSNPPICSLHIDERFPHQALEDLTTRYDLSVRNSIDGVVQFRFGDDGLDPACLEGDGQPVDFARSWTHALVGAPFSFTP
jgi:hypothetical protein